MKRKNWMITIWGTEIPRFLAKLEAIEKIYLQQEETSNKIIHWQVFAQFKFQVTKTYLIDFFKQHNTKAHIGQKKGLPEPKTVKQGIQYVSGYGQCALKKCVDPNLRFTVTNGKFTRVEFDESKRTLYERIRGQTTLEDLQSINHKISNDIKKLVVEKGHSIIPRESLRMLFFE